MYKSIFGVLKVDVPVKFCVIRFMINVLEKWICMGRNLVSSMYKK